MTSLLDGVDHLPNILSLTTTTTTICCCCLDITPVLGNGDFAPVQQTQVFITYVHLC